MPIVSLASTVDVGTVTGTFFSYFIAFAIPLILVAFGGMFSERSGIINISLEGTMVIGAMTGALILSAFNDNQGGVHVAIIPPFLATLIAIIGAAGVGALFSSLLSFAANRFKADQTVAGTALNIIAPALFVVIVWAVQGTSNSRIIIPSWINYNAIDLGATDISKIPTFINSFFFTALAKVTTLIAVIVIPVCAVVLMKTKFGLRLRACGEHPQAAQSLGINVIRMRYTGTAIGGALAGFGGLFYIMVIGGAFQGDVAGYGFLSIAVMIFGNWHPGRIVAAGFFFSFFRTMSSQVLSLSTWITWLPTFSNISYGSYIYSIIPYLITIIVLIFSSKKSKAPKAEGVPFDVSRRS